MDSDFFAIDDLLSEEERMIRDAVREWATERVVPVINGHFEAGTFPLDLVPEMGSLGFLGSTVPEEYGGGGMGPVAYGLICQELECADSGIRSFASVQSSLVMFPILTWGSEEQKRRWLPELAAGRAIGCFGLTEPDHGSDPGGMKTKARRDGDEYVLNGAKMWITNGSVADVAIVWAKDEDGVVGGFLVEKGTPGFEAPEMVGKMSLRASVTSELVFHDCRVPVSARLPEAKGLKAPLSCLTQARFGISWGACGAAMDCFDHAREYSGSRIQFGKPIAAFQLTQMKLANMLTEITKGRMLAWRLGRLKEAGKMRFDQVSLAKRNNVNMALDVARVAREILGANGIMLEYHVIRHMANLESVKTYEGTHDIHTLVLGQAITGIPAFS
jgi:glutaryl-CoA dehydrogenase